MKKGRILFLNGITSSGKTSIVDALQRRDDVFFYVVANDLFQEMVGEKYLRENYWKYLAQVVLLMYHTAALYSDLGHDVLIDGILVERTELAPHYRQLLDIIGNRPMDMIEVACPVEVCEARNIARGDRWPGQSAEQAALMNPDVRYSLRVNTDQYTPEECAEQIVRALMT